MSSSVSAPPTQRFVRLPTGTLGGILAVLVAVLGLSLGSTMVKATGSAGSVVAFWRLAIGAVIWHAIVVSTGQRFDRHAIRATALAGLLFGLNLTLFFTGVTKTRIAHAEFIGTLTPLIVVPIAAWRLKEHVPRSTIVLGATALCGVSLIVLTKTGGKSSSLVGDLMIGGAIVLWASYLLTTRKARQSLGTPLFMAGMTTVAALTVLPFSLGTHRFTDVTAKGWILISLMAVTSGLVSHGLLAWAQQQVPVSTITMIQLGQPGLGVLWAFTFLGESVRPIQLVGMGIVLFAVANIARIAAGNR